jgi:hypothetical protein
MVIPTPHRLCYKSAYGVILPFQNPVFLGQEIILNPNYTPSPRFTHSKVKVGKANFPLTTPDEIH